MRASRYFVLFYAAMVLLPLILIALVLSYLWALPSYENLSLGLLAADVLVFGVLGAAELLAGSGPEASIGTHTKENMRISEEPGPAAKGRTVTVAVDRFDLPDNSMRTSRYLVSVDRSTTVLDALISIKHKQDSALSVRYSCRMGVCGSCGMVINGKPSLACETGALACAKDGKISVAPMLGHPLLKDLVTDFDDFFEKHMRVEPWLYRIDAAEKLEAKQVYDQTPEQLAEFLPYSYCIMCGLCNDACPVVNSNPEFMGPQALAQAYRYLGDSRDQGGTLRLKPIDRLTGLWGCEFAGACSAVCPKGVDPATAIQLLKAETMASYFSAYKNKKVEQ